ncbi:hypothetical protein [Alienimonas sp. DA493]|uniref:hypothetical protein n=1 Tax=Alienimonas sp. DA493 TaxID=3373605 RepID=UPI00375502AE
MTFAPPFPRPLTRLGVLLALACGAAALPTAAADEERPLSLEEEQRAVAAQFARLEDTLLKMARYLRKTEPERSELLVRALQKAREERIEVRMKEVSDLLRSDAAAGLTPNFGDAIDRQAELVDGMRNVLALLRSEDRRKEIDSEQERLAALLKDVNRLSSEQKAAEAANRRGDAARRVAGRQRDVLERTDDVLEDVKGADAEKAAGEPNGAEPGDSGDPSEGAPGEPREPGADGESGEGMEGDAQSGEPSEGDPSDREPGEGEPGEKESEESEQPPGDAEPQEPGELQPGEPSEGTPSGEPSESGEPSPSESQPGQPSEPGPPGQPGEPGESGESQSPSDSPPQEPQDETPGREELEAAKKAMEDALKELEQAEREGALEKQAEAVKNLAEAKEKLEEILRQLREEEAELVLRALEVRFQKMLTMQQAVLTDTVSLAAVGEVTDRERARARDLARREREIGLEGAKALQLLREDGSSVAFPEALEQIAADVDFVAKLLSEEPPRFDELTQQVERDVIESLEELIDALQQELEKLQQQKQDGQSQQGQPMQPGEQALVDKISELKMLRTLQKGVNRRTRLLGLEVPAPGEAADVDVLARLRELSDRQSRIESATYDLAVGKTN